jgi:uroporphyrinogen-III synthase
MAENNYNDTFFCGERVTMSPNHNKTAIIIRSETRSSDLAASLRSSGFDVIFLPLIEIIPPSDDYASLDRAIGQIGGYDWLIFTSANGVQYFFDRLQTKGISADVLGRLNVAVVGPMTAKLLASKGCHVSMVPSIHSAKGLIDDFADIDIAGMKILFVQAREGGKELTEFLRARGGDVDVVEAYRTVPSKENYQLPENFDAVYFFSPLAVREFVGRFGISSLVGRALNPIGETTAAEIEKYIPHGTAAKG